MPRTEQKCRARGLRRERGGRGRALTWRAFGDSVHHLTAARVLIAQFPRLLERRVVGDEPLVLEILRDDEYPPVIADNVPRLRLTISQVPSLACSRRDAPHAESEA